MYNMIKKKNKIYVNISIYFIINKDLKDNLAIKRKFS